MKQRVKWHHVDLMIRISTNLSKSIIYMYMQCVSDSAVTLQPASVRGKNVCVDGFDYDEAFALCRTAGLSSG